MATYAGDDAPAQATVRRGRKLRSAIVAVIIAGAVALAAVMWRGGTPSNASYSTTPSAWTLPTLSGQGSVRLADFRGKPLVLDFFASWCTACQSELPEFLAVDRRLGGRVRFAGVDSEENGDGIGMARRSGITSWPLARDVGGSQQSGLRDALESTPGMPITAFYDSNGRLLQVRLGALSGDALAGLITQLYGVTAA